MRKSRAAGLCWCMNGALSLTKFMLVTISFAVLAVVATGCRPGDVIEPPDMKAPVRVGEVKRAAIEAVVKTIGTLKASEQAVLLAESEGRLVLGKTAEGNRLEEGDAVEAGQCIAQLKNPELVATIAIEARREEHNNARKALDRALKQAAEGFLSDAEVEPARAAATSTKYAYEAGQAQLEKLKINAPISGRIVKLAEIVDGDRVAPGTEIATVMSYGTIIAEVNIANPDFPLVESGQDVRITNFALKDETFDGIVDLIRPIADQTTRAFKAEIAIGNEDERLRPGMYVQADIVVARHEDVVVVAPELVLTRNNVPILFVVEDEKAVAREVHLGIETKEAVEVVKGVEPGDALIVEGFETLRDGTPVSVSK
jgi:membrane fusion protein, multidrug efflux system